MADDQPLTGAAALRARLKSSTQPVQPPTVQDNKQDTTTPTGAATLRTQSKVPLAGEGAAPDNTPSWGETLADAPKQFGQGLIEGGAGLLGAPAGISQWMNHKLGIQAPQEEAITNYLTPEALLGYAKHIGYDPTQPDTMTGRIVRGAGQATAALPLGAATGMGMGANAAYTYGPAALGAVAEYYGYNPLLAALPTALTMSGLERKLLIEPAIKRGATAAAEKAAAEAAAAKEAQAQHELGDAAFTRGLQEQQDVSQAQAGRGKAITEADAAKRHDSEYTGADLHLKTEHSGADADREAVASTLGQSQTIQQGGEALQDAARTWKKDKFPQQLKDAENAMYDGAVKIPQDAEGDLSHFRDSITNSFYKAGELEPAAKVLRSRMPDRLEAALDEIGFGQGLKPGTAPKATLDTMRKLRSILGDAMTSPKLLEGVDAGKMNELYRALSSDMEGAISNAAGPEGVLQFKKFNEEARRLYGLASGPVSKIISTTDKAGETILPGEAATSVLKGSDLDGSRLAQLGSEPVLKKGLNEVAASQLRTGKGAGMTQGDPDKFFSGLAPESKTALLGDDNAGKLQDAIDRRIAAENTSVKMKTSADKDLADMSAAAAKQSSASLKGAEASRQDLRESRSTEKVQLRQEAEARKAALEEANAKLTALKNPPKSNFGIEMPGWMKGVAGMGTLGGAFEAGRNLGPLAAHFPSWGADTLAATTAAGAGVLGLGARELYKNPAARKNLLQAGAATGTAPNALDALGWSVEENK